MVAVATLDPCEAIISQIANYGTANIPVPTLSSLLGVKSTTLNARFRRKRIPVCTVGRTNYVPHEQAIHLVELHRYALIGWPTLQDASKLTTVKAGTLKAMCEKGRLEGHIDLTKRLRLNPAELGNLRPANGPASAKPLEARARESFKEPNRNHRVREVSRNRSIRPNGGSARLAEVALPQISPTARRPFLPPRVAEPEVLIIRSPDRELAGLEPQPQPIKSRATGSPDNAKKPNRLVYDPLRPFSLAACSPGNGIVYGQYVGTILGLIDDPYCPRIKVAFPEHEHPEMREVLLVVGKR